MVTRVYGTCGNVPIEFVRKEANRWECSVPFNSSGRYIVAVTAEAEAGTIAFATNILIVFNFNSLKFKILPTPYAVELLPSKFGVDILPLLPYKFELLPSKFGVDILPLSPYKFEYLTTKGVFV